MIQKILTKFNTVNALRIQMSFSVVKVLLNLAQILICMRLLLQHVQRAHIFVDAL